MRRILLPLEQTDRSLKALQYFRKHYSPDEAGVIVVMVDESLAYSARMEEEEAAVKALEEKLELIRSFLDGYDVITKAYVGKAGQRIVKVAREYNTSLIAMTKSSKDDMLNQIGRTTEYVLLNAPCNVVIVSENRNSGEYKGLVYTKAQSVVNLRGQIGDKQSECLLPSVSADCNYHIEVTVGKVRFFHTAYNPETGNWDLPPANGQYASIDIIAGESVDVLVNAGITEGRSDRIRVVNRGIKQEAVFSYLITPAGVDYDAAAKEHAEAAAEEPAEPEETVAAEETVVEAPVEEIAVVETPAEEIIIALRESWNENDYFDEIKSISMEGFNMMDAFLTDIGYVPDSVIAAVETETALEEE